MRNLSRSSVFVHFRTSKNYSHFCPPDNTARPISKFYVFYDKRILPNSNKYAPTTKARRSKVFPNPKETLLPESFEQLAWFMLKKSILSWLGCKPKVFFSISTTYVYRNLDACPIKWWCSKNPESAFVFYQTLRVGLQRASVGCSTFFRISLRPQKKNHREKLRKLH